MSERLGYSSKEHANFSVERDGSLVRIKNDERSFVIYYGDHKTPMDPGRLPADIGSWIIESPPNADTLHKRWTVLPHITFSSLEYSEQTAPIVSRIRLEEKNVVLADIQYDEPYSNSPLSSENILLTGETVAGIQIGFSSLESFLQKPISRRSFLRLAGTGLGAWLTLPFVSKGAIVFSNETEIGNQLAADLEALSNSLHPESDVKYVLVRNTILAHKMDWIARNVEGCKNLGLIVGAGHVGIEAQLNKTPEQRLAYLDMLPKSWRKTVDIESFYKITFMELGQNELKSQQSYEVPDLKRFILG